MLRNAQNLIMPMNHWKENVRYSILIFGLVARPNFQKEQTISVIERKALAQKIK